MFGKSLVADMITRSAETPSDRRRFLRSAGLMGLGVLGAGVAGTATAASAAAAANGLDDDGVSDATVLNFALNLEYLEAEFYSYAAFGHGLENALTTGTGTRGGVKGGRRVPFESRVIKQYAEEIAGDELAHVKFLRTNLGSAAVSRPAIDLQDSFTAAARAAGLIKAGEAFDPYANENNFLLAAFLFEDVGVTAYKGASPLIDNDVYLEAAAGILAVEAYHAGLVRGVLYERELGAATRAISDARDSLDGTSDLDQGATSGPARTNRANIVPTDASGVAFSRSPGQVLNVVYLNPGKVDKGGFFPAGVNGDVRVSG
ncbi:ferritin-like domain-containing protein [Quadrisphaera sp. DSM 44207]|uniref:ferritin-like domain-containing protein n=1 Tax=Quadrisphaera sp. DSM 44207 TaxID=1881057 RepID=UPI00088B9EC4|nr:ferritin-like domain-containing protein [Quadrisphaera sp. DSM 44207]SDQ52704.1 Ferritin-like domain-containing protein [Quadrisphaera sp. DSM 44207]